MAGAFRGGNEPLVFSQGPAEIAHRKRLIPAFLLALGLMAPVAIFSILTVYNSGYAGMRLDARAGVVINTTSNGWMLEAQMMLVPLSVLFAWTFRFRWWSLLPLVLFVTVRAGTGGRGPFVVACMAAGMLWLFDSKRRWPTLRIFAITIPLILVFGAIGKDRAAVRTYFDDNAIVKAPARTGFLESMDWANMEFFEYIVETVPRKTGTYGYFVDNLQVFTEPVPRKLWKNKPLGAPIKMFNLFDYGDPIGITYSLPGYGWMQLGYLGVALWCALWGYALGAIYSRFMRSRQGNFQVALYFAFLPLFIIAFRDGGLVTVARTGVFYITPVLVWMWSARAMGIPDPTAPVRQASRAVGRGRAPSILSPPPRRRAAGQEIVPRAWRGRDGSQRAE